MLILTGLLTLLVFTIVEGDGIKGGVKTAQEKVNQDEIVPSPYSFNIKTGAAYGTKVTQEEVGDAQGRVKGSYSIASPRGVSRVVEYHADDSGFHASVKSSEPNIKTHSPANAHIEVLTKKGASEAIRHAAQDPIDHAGKAHALPALHHTAVLPQSQEKIQEKIILESEPSGVKTSDPLKLTTTKGQAGGIKSVASPSAEIKQSTIKSVVAASSGVKQSGVKTINVPNSGVKSPQSAADSGIKRGVSSQHQQFLQPSSISASAARKSADSSSGAVLLSLGNERKANPGQQRDSLDIKAKPFQNPSGSLTANAQSELIGGNRNIILDEDIIKKLGLTSDGSGHYIVLPPGLANIAGSELENKIRIAGQGLNQGIQVHSSGEKLIEKNEGRSGSISRASPEIKPVLRSQTAISRQTSRDQIRKLPTVRRQSSLQANGRLTSGTALRNIGQIPRQRSSNQIGAQGLYTGPAYGINIAQGPGQSIQTRRTSSSLQKEEKASFLSLEPNLNFQSGITDRANIRLLTSGDKYDSPVLPALPKDKLVSPAAGLPGSIRPKASFDRVLNQGSGFAASPGSLQTSRTPSATLRGSNLQKQISAGRTAITENRLTGIGSGSADSKSGSIYFVLGDSLQQQKPAAAGLTPSGITQSAAKPQIISGIPRPEIVFSARAPETVQPQISPAVSQRLTGIRTSQFQVNQRVSGSPASSSQLNYQQAVRSSSTLGRRTSVGSISRSPGQTLSVIASPQIVSTGGGSAGIRSEKQFGVRQSSSGAGRSQISSNQRTPSITTQRITRYQQETRSSAGLGSRGLKFPEGIFSQSVSGVGGSQLLFTPAVSGASLFQGKPGVSQRAIGIQSSELLLGQIISGAPISQVLASNQQAARSSASLSQKRSDVTTLKRLGEADKAILGDSGQQIVFATGTLKPAQPQSQSAYDRRISEIRSSQIPATQRLAGIPAPRLSVASGASQAQGTLGLTQKAADIRVSQLSPEKKEPAAPASKPLSIPSQAFRSSASLGLRTSGINQLAGKEQIISGIERPEIVFGAGALEAIQPQISPAVSQGLAGVRTSQLQTSKRLSVASVSSSPLPYQQNVGSSSTLGSRTYGTAPATLHRSSGQTLSFIGGLQTASVPSVSPGRRSEKDFGVRESFSGARPSQISSSQRISGISAPKVRTSQQATRSFVVSERKAFSSSAGTSAGISGIGASEILLTSGVPDASHSISGISSKVTNVPRSQLSRSQITPGAPIFHSSAIAQEAARRLSSGRIASDITIGSLSEGKESSVPVIDNSQIVFGGFRPEGTQPQRVSQLTHRGTGISSSQFSGSQGISGAGALSSTSQQAVRSSTSSDRRTYGIAEGISSGIFSQPGSGIGGHQISFITGVAETGDDKNLLGGRVGSSGSAASQLLRNQRLPGSITSQSLTSNQQASRSAATFNRRVSGSIPVAVSGTNSQTISGTGASQYSVLQTQSRGIQQNIRSQISGQRRPGGSVLPLKYQQPARIPAIRISGAPQKDQSVIIAGGSQSLFNSGKPVSVQTQRTVSGRASSSTSSQLSSIQRTSGIPISRNDPIYQRGAGSSEALKRRIPNLILDASSGGIDGLIADVRGSQLSSLRSSSIGSSSGALGISQRNSGARSSQLAKNARVSAAPKPSLLSISGAADLRSASQRTGIHATSLRNIGIQGASGTGRVAGGSPNVELLKIPSATESRSPQISHSNAGNIGLAQAERHNLNKIVPEVGFYGSSAQSIPGSSRIVSQASGLRKPETGKLNLQSKIESPVLQEKLHTKDIAQKEVLQLKEPSIKFDQVEQSKLSANPSQVLVDVPTSQEKLSDGSQIKIDEVIEHSAPSQPQIIKLTQVKETVIGKKHSADVQQAEDPSKPVVSKTTVTKVVSESAPKPAGAAFGSRDVQSVQQKLTDLEQSQYLPPASILSPFNYAVPILPSARTSVKAPIVQEQQKLEQILV